MNSYLFRVSLFDLTLFGLIFISLTVSLQLWFSTRTNRAANRLLALSLLAMALWTLRVVTIDIRISRQLEWIPLGYSLAIGPLIYFYTLKCIQPEYKLRVKAVW